MTQVAVTLQGFFTDRLARQRQASPRTVAAYRDSIKLLLRFVHQQTGKTVASLDWSDLDAGMITTFLNQLETVRGNSIRTRNLRLTAIRSLFAYAALHHPEHALLIQRVLAIPYKRLSRRLVNYLTRSEVEAVLASVDKSTWIGRRNHALLLVAMQTGLRLSEITGLRHWTSTFKGRPR